MNAVVLDAQALLTLLRGEAGHERVVGALDGPCSISALSLLEVLKGLPGANPRAVLEDLESLGIEIVPLDVGLALEAARIQQRASSETASALALAKIRGEESLLQNAAPEARPSARVGSPVD